MKFQDATAAEIDAVMNAAWEAFPTFRETTVKQRADLMRRIATEIGSEDQLIRTAMEETNLPEARLRNELARTQFQLTSYAEAGETGTWLDVRIDTAVPDKGDPDLRKWLVPLGPVVVFGASNFPFAYSTAGGDTASALAAGCPVIVKAHPAHAGTSEIVAGAIARAVKAEGLPAGVFAHVHGAGTETGKNLIMHPHTSAVGFTGSYGGGKALFDWANQRKVPIPVFAEMGSINPIFILPGKLAASTKELATTLAASITLGVGQFCTNPGLIIGIEGPDLDLFMEELGTAIAAATPGTMLHPGIAKAYGEKRGAALAAEDVATIAVSGAKAQTNQGAPTLASATAEAFFRNPLLHQEVFGPYSLVIQCKHPDELLKVARQLEGQLTTTLMATDADIRNHPRLVRAAQDICGRLILNGVPTGVRVALSMQHGGPFPATTDSRFTSVGADGIKRWARPISYQNWPDHLLPEALQNKNSLKDLANGQQHADEGPCMKKTFFCIDAHTCGNPVRLVAGGGPVLEGRNMSEKRQHFLREFDWIRKGLMFEPRGHDMMSGSILYPPHDPENDVAVLFIETSGCLPMCGHGTIGTITIAIEEGLIQPKTPGRVRMEAPAGLVMIEYRQEGKKVVSVKLTNVPAYLAAENIAVECPELGTLHVDVAYGGNFYAIVDTQEHFSKLDDFSAGQLIGYSRVMRRRINETHTFVHPVDPTIHSCTHILWSGATIHPDATARNAVFYGDKAIDRSPCGTGTSARMAQWFAKGKLKVGDKFIHESIIGSRFTGTVEKAVTVAGKPAIIPSIEGWAKVYGYNTISIDPDDDPYAYGFQVG